MRPWLEFQSTVGILADPPPGYMFPGVDMLGGLRNMSSMVENDEYDNQYDFIVDLYSLINVKPREGHLGYEPSLISAIAFQTPVIFISISEDGVALPRVYLHEDYLASITARYDPSPVESYDGVPIVEWLQQRSIDNGGSQDPDAAYNAQLWSAPLANIGQTSAPYRVALGNLSDNSTLVFNNGSEIEIQNYAVLQGDWEGITSPLDVHRRFEVPTRGGRAQSEPYVGRLNTAASSLADLEGYPDPLLRHSDNYLSGYIFGSDEGSLTDTAVIAVKSFMTNDTTADLEKDMDEFADLVNDLVGNSSDAGAKRLIIDFQGNGGGTLGNLAALVNVLFPRDDIWMPMRARANEVLDWMGSTASANRVDMSEFFPFDFRVSHGEDDKLFGQWSDFYKNEEILGDQFTQLFQPIFLTLMVAEPRRFGKSRHGEYFDPANVVIVTDGYCASACAIAVGLLTRTLGIHTVAMGGRPIEAPMQAIGGTKGGPVVGLDIAQRTFMNIAATESRPRALDADTFFSNPPLAGPPAQTFVVNTANVHLHNDNDGVPVQFLYEAANCKLFYTWETLTNMTLLWGAVADIKWNGAPCVAKSTTNDDNTMSDDVASFDYSYVSNYTWAKGPGDVSDRPPEGEAPEQGTSGGSGSGGSGGTGNNDNTDNAAPRLGASLTSLVALVVTLAFFF